MAVHLVLGMVPGAILAEFFVEVADEPGEESGELPVKSMGQDEGLTTQLA